MRVPYRTFQTIVQFNRHLTSITSFRSPTTGCRTKQKPVEEASDTWEAQGKGAWATLCDTLRRSAWHMGSSTIFTQTSTLSNSVFYKKCLQKKCFSKTSWIFMKGHLTWTWKNHNYWKATRITSCHLLPIILSLMFPHRHCPKITSNLGPKSWCISQINYICWKIFCCCASCVSC